MNNDDKMVRAVGWAFVCFVLVVTAYLGGVAVLLWREVLR